MKRQAKNANAGSKTKLERILAPTVFVAVVAGRRGVRVAVNAAMLIVSFSLLVRSRSVAIDASEAGEIGRNLMAVVADRAMVRNGEVRVIKGSAEPAGRVVATSRVAGGWEATGDVVRNGTAEGLRAGPLCDVAAVAGGIRGGQSVVSGHMAVRTLLNSWGSRRHHVSAG